MTTDKGIWYQIQTIRGIIHGLFSETSGQMVTDHKWGLRQGVPNVACHIKEMSMSTVTIFLISMLI